MAEEWVESIFNQCRRARVQTNANLDLLAEANWTSFSVVILEGRVVMVCALRHIRANKSCSRDRSAAFRRSGIADRAALPIDLRGPIAIIPPGLGHAARVPRFGRRSA